MSKIQLTPELRWELGDNATEFVQLINLIREIGWGELTIQLKNGAPVMVSRTREDIKIGN